MNSFKHLNFNHSIPKLKIDGATKVVIAISAKFEHILERSEPKCKYKYFFFSPVNVKSFTKKIFNVHRSFKKTFKGDSIQWPTVNFLCSRWTNLMIWLQMLFRTLTVSLSFEWRRIGTACRWDTTWKYYQLFGLLSTKSHLAHVRNLLWIFI